MVAIKILFQHALTTQQSGHETFVHGPNATFAIQLLCTVHHAVVLGRLRSGLLDLQQALDAFAGRHDCRRKNSREGSGRKQLSVIELLIWRRLLQSFAQTKAKEAHGENRCDSRQWSRHSAVEATKAVRTDRLHGTVVGTSVFGFIPGHW